MKKLVVLAVILCIAIISACGSEADSGVADLAEPDYGDSMQENMTIEPAELSMSNADDQSEWNPTEENTFVYLGTNGETNGLLEWWIEAYRSGEYAQIYMNDPRDGLFQTWRITANGTNKYLIERNILGGAAGSVEFIGYSSIVTEGVIYYTFGEDLADVDMWLPMAVLKGINCVCHSTVEKDNEIWVQQAQIAEVQAAELAVEVFSSSEVFWQNNLTFQVTGRFVYLGQAYYEMKIYFDENHAGWAAISADGTVFWDITNGWTLIKDKAAVQVLPYSYLDED